MKNDIKKLHEICKLLYLDFPNPETELKFTNEFTLLIAIILSAQTTDKMVNIATKLLFESIKNPQDLIKIGIDELKIHIKKVNYYNTKAKNIFNTAKILINEYNEKIPHNFKDLIKLNGVGRKTANVFLNIACNLPTIAVDTHVFRATNRIFGKNFIKPEETEDFLLKINQHEFAIKTHHLLILHGRYTCKARNPQCQKCKISHFCIHFKNVIHY